MKKKTTPEAKTRAYDGSLRAEQAQLTRSRILEAVRSLIAGGDRTLRYADLAREAGVSMPTLYRHFPSRADLFEALYHETQGDPEAADAVHDLATADAHVRSFFARFDDEEGVYAKAARLNALWEFSRASTVPRRRAWFETILARDCPDLPEPQRTWVVDLGVVLVSSVMAESCRGYLDLDGAATADRVMFALDALFAHARRLAAEAAS